MGGYLSHFVSADQPDTNKEVDAMKGDNKTFLHIVLEHICLCVMKEYLDGGDGPGEQLNSFPLLRALLLYTRRGDLERKPQLKRLLRVAAMVCHAHLATRKNAPDEFRKTHMDALIGSMDGKLDASRPKLPNSVVAKAKGCAVALTLAVDGYEKAVEQAERYCKAQSMVQYRHKLMQTLQALKKGSTSVEGVLEAFSMTDFLKEFDSIVEELYAEFAPSVVEQVCEQLGIEKVLCLDPLTKLSGVAVSGSVAAAHTLSWEGFEAAVERMERGASRSMERGDDPIEDEEEEEEDLRPTSRRRSNQKMKERREHSTRKSKMPHTSTGSASSSEEREEEEEEEGFEENSEGEEDGDVPEESVRRATRSQRGHGKRQTRHSPKKPQVTKKAADSDEEWEGEEDVSEDIVRRVTRSQRNLERRVTRQSPRKPQASKKAVEDDEELQEDEGSEEEEEIMRRVTRSQKEPKEKVTRQSAKSQVSKRALESVEEEGVEGDEDVPQKDVRRATKSQTELERRQTRRSPRKPVISDLESKRALKSEDEEVEEGNKEDGDVPEESVRRVTRSQREHGSRQTRHSPKKPQASKRAVESDEEWKEWSEGEEDGESGQRVTRSQREPERRVTRQSPRKPQASKKTVESDDDEMEEQEEGGEEDEEIGRRVTRSQREPEGRATRQSSNKLQALKTEPMEISHQESPVKEVRRKESTPSKDASASPSHALRRTPRIEDGQKTSVSEFARKLQGKEEGAAKETKKIKLAGVKLDPRVMSTSEDNDESDTAHTVRRHPRTSPQKQADKEEGNTSMPPHKRKDRPLSSRYSAGTVVLSSAGEDSTEVASIKSRKRRRPSSFRHSAGTVTVLDEDHTDSPSGKRKKVTPTEIATTKESTSPSRRPRVDSAGTTSSAGPTAEGSGSELSKRQNPSSIRPVPISSSRNSESSSDSGDFDFDVESPNLKSPSRFQPKVMGRLNWNASRRRIPWSQAEVTWLKKGVAMFGVGHWTSIKSHFPLTQRTGTDLKDKWRNLPQEEKNEVLGHYA